MRYSIPINTDAVTDATSSADQGFRGGLVRAVIAGAAALLLAAACTPVPKVELTAYVDAFGKTEAAIEQALVDMDAAEAVVKEIKARREAEKNDSGANTPTAGTIQTTIDLRPAAAEPESQSAKRRRALEVVARFNATMVALAEGRSDAEVRASTEGLVGNLQALGSLANIAVPGSQVVIGSLSTAIAALEKARNRQQFMDAMRVAAPIIDQILVLFREDAEDVFEFLAEETRDNLILAAAGVFEVGRQMRDLTEIRKPPAGTQIQTHKSLGQKLVDARATVRRPLTGEPLPTGDSTADYVYDDLTLNQLSRMATEALTIATRYRALEMEHTARIEAYQKYGALLAQTRRTLGSVLLAIDRPPEVRQQALELIGIAFETKRSWQKWRAADRASAK